ncbi:MAG: hypothetical protein ABJB86_07635 [Bacteroidota bacterium]
MKKIVALLLTTAIYCTSFSQGVGIGTTLPDAKSILDIKSTDKGILFPRLTTTQRDNIINPPNSLHIFNTDQSCLNYYDSVNHTWNCYCENCRTVIINITSNYCKLDFYNQFARQSPASKYVINIGAAVTISGCNPGDTAFIFSSMNFNATITINNYGTIAGAGGQGGSGTVENECSAFALPFQAQAGLAGGAAISTKAGVLIKINNYGTVAGGGGGGGGSGQLSAGYGGGGGGGAGTIGGSGGNGGGSYHANSPFPGCTIITGLAQSGSIGLAGTGGQGGAGTSGSPAGGNGGVRGQTGQSGTGNLAAAGGIGGKAITGGSGNTITNIASGNYFGLTD